MLSLRATLVLVTISGIHHLGLTVRDLDTSASWYESVLGFQRRGGFDSPDGVRRKVFLYHHGMRVRLGLTQHRDHPSGIFNETAVGLDHLAFAVPTRDDLCTWAERLDNHGVPRSPISAANSISGAEVLVFRDPDNIQLEFFCPAAH
jgi:glyoxylase I family protein